MILCLFRFRSLTQWTPHMRIWSWVSPSILSPSLLLLHLFQHYDTDLTFCVQHDAQMDYYGTRLATCSSDRSVKIFDVKNGGQILVADLRGYVKHSTKTRVSMESVLILILILILYWQPWGSSVAGGLGSPHVRQHPGILLLRQEGDHLEGGERHLG